MNSIDAIGTGWEGRIQKVRGGVTGGRLCMVKERSSVYVMIVDMVHCQK